MLLGARGRPGRRDPKLIEVAGEAAVPIDQIYERISLFHTAEHEDPESCAPSTELRATAATKR